ncbi:MAG TPA: vitamin K epoxide reductase family protein [Pirellulaceae bacterium]|nr:vitamin K epoxide reductase family protein [Pirellulaceae bacterium]HMP69845.1 vitamin K epoxide reductase family protein [Pirellulaceae bacterium]
MNGKGERLVGLPMPGVLVRTVIVGLSIAALSIALYLTAISWGAADRPVGCGEESGCAEVLNSRWSVWFGIPVSLLAATVYVSLIGLMIWLPAVKPTRRGTMWFCVLTIAMVLLCAAAWFVGLQVIYLQAICPWCMTEHALGTLIALAILSFHIGVAQYTQGQRNNFVRRSLVGPFMVAMLMIAQLVLGQAYGPFKEPQAERLEHDISGNVVGEGAQRTVSMLDGVITIRPNERPIIGNLNAAHIVVVMLDYCCPHCRTTHTYLKQALQRADNEFALVICPVPLNSDCNPFWKNTDPRFAESCSLAKLALAVWKISPTHFSTIDTWLFESAQPRKYIDALAYAQSLVDGKELAELLASATWLDTMIQENATFYEKSGAERLPVIAAPGLATVVGRPGSQDELDEMLRNELGVKFSN